MAKRGKLAPARKPAPGVLIPAALKPLLTPLASLTC